MVTKLTDELRMNIQLFNDLDVESDDLDIIEDDEDFDNEDVTNEEEKEDEELGDDGDNEEEDVEEDDSPENPVEGDEDSTEDSEEDSDDDIRFNDKQQQLVDEIVKKRIAREERKLMRQLQEAAGVDIDTKQGEHLEAISLWGFLKSNPELSAAVQQAIDGYIQEGKAKIPEKKPSVDNELELREAIIDFKEENSTFRKNHKQILEWAEDEGFDVKDKKSLKLAFLAWQGANAKKQLAETELKVQRKIKEKSKKKRKAALQGSRKSGKAKTIDYLNASDQDILAHEGVSLFIDE